MIASFNFMESNEQQSTTMERDGTAFLQNNNMLLAGKISKLTTDDLAASNQAYNTSLVPLKYFNSYQWEQWGASQGGESILWKFVGYQEQDSKQDQFD